MRPAKKQRKMAAHWEKRFWSVRTLAGIVNSRRAYGGPVTLNVGLTDNCNLCCIHCRFRSARKQKRPLQQEQIDRYEKPESANLLLSNQSVGHEADSRFVHNLIEEVTALHTPRIVFAGNGEPLLHRNALDFIAHAKHLGRHTSIFTNGTPLNRETVDEAIRAELDVLRVSILAASAAEYANTHPGAEPTTFDQLKSHLLYLSDRKKAYASTIPRLVLYTTVLAQNCGGVSELASLAEELDADEVVFLALDDMEDDSVALLAPNEGQVEFLQKKAKSVAAYLDEKEIQHNLAAFAKGFHRGVLDTRGIYQRIPCYYGWLASVIKPDGNVFFCCPASLPIGNLHDHTFTTIWHSSAYEQLRKEAKTIHMRRASVTASACHKCVHYSANLRVNRFLRPFAR